MTDQPVSYVSQSLADPAYREMLRVFIARNGTPVFIDEHEREVAPDDPSSWVSTHGWIDTAARDHTWEIAALDASAYGRAAYAMDPDRYAGCHWIVPEGVHLVEVNYSQFGDSVSGNREEVGFNVSSTSDASIDCACGKYTSMTLRYVGSLGDVMRSLFNSGKPGWTL